MTVKDAITTDVRELHRRAAEGFGRRVTTVRPEQWGLPTPCTGWDVRALVNHVVSGNRWTPELLAGHTISDVGDRLEGDLLGDDPVGAWTDSAAAAVAAARNSDLTEPVQLSSGPELAAEYLTQVFADLLIHTWDLARAVGADDTLEPDLVAACAGWFAGVADLCRQAGVVGPRLPVPATADPQTRLLAEFGRAAAPTRARPVRR
jgi:uncharacterized protein (TIGR03086 family)